MNEIKTKLSPPWVTYMNKVAALFGEDPEIECEMNYHASDPTITLFVSNPDKAAALAKLIHEDVWFGNVMIFVHVDCDKMSNRAFPTFKELFETAFNKNPAFAYTVVPDTQYFLPLTYVVFKNRVVQFFNDNLNDPHGIVSTLYQDIAAEIFEEACPAGVAFCTDVDRNIGLPLGEWP